jgi:Ran GTPase-activating protein (RanGAP) involved in mRNA processing and transport
LSGDSFIFGFSSNIYSNIGGKAGAKHVANMLLVNGGLTKVSLAKNELGEEGTKAICEALEQNKTLKELDFSGNMFGKSNIGGKAGVNHVAKMLGVNSVLTSIDLSGNKLCGILIDPNGINQQGTYTAEGITAIADALRVNGALTKLSIYGNHIGDEGVRAICEAIQSNKETKLASLELGFNNIGQVGATSVAAMVAVTTGGLTKLSLAHDELGEEGTKAICEALEQNKTLKELNLRGSRYHARSVIGGPAGAKYVSKMLGVNGSLTECDLSANWFGAEGAKQLADALRVNGALTCVDIRYTLGGDGAAHLAAAVLGNLKIEMFNEIPIKEMRANSLTELDLKGKDFGFEGGMVVAGLIPVMGALTRADVRRNNIAGDGAVRLAAAVLGNLKIEMFNEIPIKEMRANSLTLTELDLKGKDVGVEGGMVVAGLIPVMGGLTALDLSSNSLKDEGASAVCEAIQSNKETKLSSLNFKGNGIGPVGANAVAAMVAVTGGLTSIDLSENALCGVVQSFGGVSGTYTAEGITAIADALRVNGGLTSLGLSNNALCGVSCFGGTYTAEGITAIADALRVNGALTKIE